MIYLPGACAANPAELAQAERHADLLERTRDMGLETIAHVVHDARTANA